MTGRESYLAKLRDPRWQKKRLDILQRDQWTCQLCDDKKTTLTVHHRYYLPRQEPWDYPDECLVTLCEYCHRAETEAWPEIIDTMSFALKSRFWATSADYIACNLGSTKPNNLDFSSGMDIAVLLEWLLGNPEARQEVIMLGIQTNQRMRQWFAPNQRRRDATTY